MWQVNKDTMPVNAGKEILANDHSRTSTGIDVDCDIIDAAIIASNAVHKFLNDCYRGQPIRIYRRSQSFPNGHEKE